jgi:hypothetical protein
MRGLTYALLAVLSLAGAVLADDPSCRKPTPNPEGIAGYLDQASGSGPLAGVYRRRFYSDRPQGPLRIPVRVYCEGVRVKEGLLASTDPDLLREVVTYGRPFRDSRVPAVRALDKSQNWRVEYQPAPPDGPWVEIPAK